jgi:thiamine biosynthesis protein ThiS
MKIVLNGRETAVSEGATIAALLGSLELPPLRVAVERNREVVPRHRYPEVELEEGDRVEIVRFVGGG